jgi:hypothetical protein
MTGFCRVLDIKIEPNFSCQWSLFVAHVGTQHFKQAIYGLKPIGGGSCSDPARMSAIRYVPSSRISQRGVAEVRRHLRGKGLNSTAWGGLFVVPVMARAFATSLPSIVTAVLLRPAGVHSPTPGLAVSCREQAPSG